MVITSQEYRKVKSKHRGLSSGPVAGSLPANARGTGSIPGPGRSHMPRGSWAHLPQLLKPGHSRTRVPQQEEPPRWEALTPRAEQPQLEKPKQSNEDQGSQIHTNRWINRGSSTGQGWREAAGVHRACNTLSSTPALSYRFQITPDLPTSVAWGCHSGVGMRHWELNKKTSSPVLKVGPRPVLRPFPGFLFSAQTFNTRQQRGVLAPEGTTPQKVGWQRIRKRRGLSFCLIDLHA